MEETHVLRVLYTYNPWWSNKPISPTKTSDFKRGEFFVIKEKMLPQRDILSIIGPRRVGKTIVIHQLIKDLLDAGVDPTRILYLSIDEYNLTLESIIEDVLNTYSKYIIKSPLDSLDKPCYVFFDEIQEVPDWSRILKNWYDLGYKIKFVISGSSSIWLTKGAEESLLGRIKTVIMMPLKFSEILKYNGILPEGFYKRRNLVRASFKEAAYSGKLDGFTKELESFIGYIAGLRDLIQIQLNKYMIVGGYPEFLENSDYAAISAVIKEKLKLILYKDIVRYFKIRDPTVLEGTLQLIAKGSGEKFNVDKTRQVLDIQRPTLKQYVKYLTKAFLIRDSEFYSNSRKVRLRKQNKYYVLDVGIRNALQDYLDESLLLDSTELGMVVQGIVFDHITRLKFNLEPGPDPSVFYWNNGKEIDFVTTLRRKPIPFESKYSASIGRDTLDCMEKFIVDYKSPFGVIVTKDELQLGAKILFIPLWVFLLLV